MTPSCWPVIGPSPSTTPTATRCTSLASRRQTRPRVPRRRAALRRRAEQTHALRSGFSLLATLLQWALLEARLVSPTMQASSRWLSGTLLLAAGLYQLTPLKQVCLTRCRSPLAFLTEEWRKGLRAGAVGLSSSDGALPCCSQADRRPVNLAARPRARTQPASRLSNGHTGAAGTPCRTYSEDSDSMDNNRKL